MKTEDLTPKLRREALAWIDDCFPEDIRAMELTDEEIISDITRYYSGGWTEFIRCI